MSTDTADHSPKAEPDRGADIAIVGMACNLPSAPDLESWWSNLCAQRDGITRMNQTELLAAGQDLERIRGTRFVPAMGMLPDIDRFDAGFFGYERAEAELIDPQHRMFLECASRALQDGGIDPGQIDGLISVFAGCGPSTYLLTNLLQNSATVYRYGLFKIFQENDKDVLPSRLSYALDLTGPSVCVQSCSSTSLSAVSQACGSLVLGESDVAVAGAVTVQVPQEPGYDQEPGSLFSPGGVPRAFDADADGKVPANGVGAVVLRRLEDAEADGDRIYAVIRGWGVNHEGRSRDQFGRPSVAGRAAIVAEALAASGVGPGDIDHLEVSSNAAPFNDVVEISALQHNFDCDEVDTITLGTLDANIGHVNQAAGVARLIKAALALHHEMQPGAANFDKPNPQLEVSGDRLVVQRETAPWPRGERPRRTGVTAYGFGGTNAHVVVEEAPLPPIPVRPTPRPHQLLIWSARSEESVNTFTTRLEEAARSWEPAGTDLADVAYSLQVGRTGHPHRRMTVVDSPSDAVEALSGPARVLGATVTAPRPVGFLLPGVGEQYEGMAGGLYATEPVFAAAVDECRERFTTALGSDPIAALVGSRSAPADDLALMLGRGGSGDAGEGAAATTVVQPAVFTLGYALGALFREWGLAPAVLAGYSVGEFAAAALAGALTLHEASGLVARRAQLISTLPGGAMVAVPASASELSERLGGGLDIAAVNGPKAVVVSGTPEAVESLTARLAEEAVPARPLRTTHAFHSRQLRPVAAELTAWARANLAPRSPAVPYLSNVTGAPVTDAQLRDPGYWAEHMCRPVQFAAMVEHLTDRWPGTALAELGAGRSLGAMIRQIPAFPRDDWNDLVPVLPGESDPSSDTETLAGAIGRLWSSGVPVDWRAYHAGRDPRKTTLPTYAFDHERCWIDATDPIVVPEPPAAVAENT